MGCWASFSWMALATLSNVAGERRERLRELSVCIKIVQCVCVLTCSLLHSFHKFQLIHKTISDTRFGIVLQDCKLVQTPLEVSVIAILFVQTSTSLCDTWLVGCAFIYSDLNTPLLVLANQD